MPYTDLTEDQRFFPGSVPFLEGVVTRSGINSQGAIIPCGFGVVLADDDNLLEIPSATGQTFMGVAAHADTLEKRGGFSLTADGLLGWPEAYSMSFHRRGIVPVFIDSACSKGDPVYLIHTADTGQTPGHFAATALAGDADLIAAVFHESLAAPGLGLIELNLP